MQDCKSSVDLILMERAFRRARRLYKPKKKEGYFIFPSVRDRLPEMQRDYVRRLNKLVLQLYGRAGQGRKLGGKS